MQLFYQPGIADGVHYLEPEESRHCVKVLRKHQYDSIDLIDGKGNFYKAQLLNTDPRKTEFEILSQKSELVPDYKIHLALAPTKRMERMEWLVEKATEMGVDRISFLYCQNSERKEIRLERLKRKAISAMKQSLRATLPQIAEITSFKSFITSLDNNANNYIAHLEPQTKHLFEAIPKSANYTVIIGPEGDFSEEELSMAQQHQIKAVHLGAARLRSETAALTALITMQLKQGV